MEPLAFFHTKAVRNLLEEASRAAAMPLSVHYVAEEEGTLVAGIGACAACRYVAETPSGAAACRDARAGASVAALRRNKSVPFICHMGFACVAAPALPERGAGFAMTFGPYCPAESPLGLEHDAEEGLANLGRETAAEEPLPFPLSDIRIVPADAPLTLAEWTRERIGAAWESGAGLETHVPETAPQTAAEEAARPGRGKTPQPPETSRATAIVLAMAAGNRTQARELVMSALSETDSAKKVKLAVRRARTVALAGAALEAGERAGVSMDRCWEQFGGFLERVRAARRGTELSSAVLDLLKLSRRRASRNEGPPALSRLNAIIADRLVEGITLNEVARELNESPTAITHRLQRKFGMSFSQYVGRLRTDKAKELLRRTRLGVGEVARRVGIRDASNLGKLFRKFEGLSPKDYRTKFRRNQ